MLGFLIGLIPNVVISIIGSTRRGALVLGAVSGVLVAVFMVVGLVYFIRALH